jgi:NitT/TauT family transport system substrate-binding protein
MTLRTRLSVATAMAAALVITATGCASTSTPTGNSTDKPLTQITVSFNPASQDAPLFVGMDAGIFAKHGIIVQVVPQTDVAAIVSGVASGQYNFGFATAVHILNAHVNNIPIKAVSTVDGQQAAKEKDDQGNALLAGGKSGIKSPADLGGKKLGVIGLASLNTLAAQELAAKAGVDVKTITLVQLPFGQMPAALASGDVDAAVVQSPFIAEAVSTGAKVIAKPNVELFANQAVGFFVTSDGYISSNPEVIKGFSDAMIESQAFAAANIQTAQKTLINHLNLTPAAAAAATWCTDCKPEVNTTGIENVQKLMKTYAGLKVTTPVKELVWSGAIKK